MALNSDKEVVETVYTNTVYLYLSGSTSHVHSWSSDWSSDETYHWHECIADNCNYTLNNVKDGYVDHTFVWVDNGDNTHSWVCSVCGYVETENQNHSFGEQVEQGDENGHWVVCECGAYYRLGAHTYGAPTFNWAENYSTATASFSCSTCGYPVTVDCEVESVTTDVTCEEDGKTVYTATATFNGAEYTDTQTVTEEGTATGHSYGEPTFNWAEDYSTATAAFTCSGCSNVLEVGCGVTSSTTAATCTADAYTVYTASVSLDGTPYTDTQTVTEENTATGHSYG
ncbi:MAG: hypothetical protein LJU34_01350, partial [Oscillospiraceae bacterium]|nr:hypothetical protein [Oscillospiraceae bacterium]